MKQRIKVEQLLGRKVRDPAGKVVGRIEEIRCEDIPGIDARTVVTTFLLGKGGLMERLSISDVSQFFIGFLGAYRGASQSAEEIPWHLMDLSDPAAPKLAYRAEDIPHEK